MWRSMRLAVRMTSTTGVMAAIAVSRSRAQRDMSRMTWWAMKILMTMATGNRIRSTGMYGSREWQWAGRLITTGTGHGSIPGDGRGWMTTRGAMRHSTMDVGLRLAGAGDGFRDPWRQGRFTLPGWWYSRVGADVQ